MSEAQLAVERALARVMAARHPGSAWVPASLCDESDLVVRLVSPPHSDPVNERGPGARRAA